MFTATLRCGHLLSFEAKSFLPDPGDLVPCRHHGYCTVERVGGSGGPKPRVKCYSRATPRAQTELLEWLRHRPVTTVHSLRRQRFTLRMIAEVARDGIVDLDLCTGRVAVNSKGLARKLAEAPELIVTSRR